MGKSIIEAEKNRKDRRKRNKSWRRGGMGERRGDRETMGEEFEEERECLARERE